MLNKMSMKVKIGLIIGVMVISAILITVVASTQFNKISQQLIVSLHDEGFESISLTLNADRDIYQALVEIQKILHTDISGEDYNKSVKAYQENMNQVKDKTAEAKKILMADKTKWEKYAGQQSGKNIFGYFDELAMKFSEFSKTADAMVNSRKEIDGWEKKFDDAREDLNAIGEMMDNASKNITNELAAQKKSLITNIVVITLLGLASAVVLSLIFIRSITKAIKQIESAAQKLATGDLSIEVNVESKDEIGSLANAFRTLIVNLKQMINSIRDTSKAVSSAASEISQGNEDLSQRTQEQAASLEETSSAIEELTATVKQNEENANNANKLSAKVMDLVKEGDQVLKETIHSMGDATQSSKKINDIINVVNEIAFQTNLLALNAAVEAARAGEQGKGFAVVAVEVRNLAQRSSEAAKEIQTLIKDSVDKIENSNKLVLSTGSKLENMMVEIKNMSQIVSEITAASKEQSVGIEEVNRAITQMDQVTQQNASLVEESAASSEAMKNEAEDLLGLVMQFKTEDESHEVEKENKKRETVQQRKKVETGTNTKAGFDGFEKF